jgi:hypothetical protein
MWYYHPFEGRWFNSDYNCTFENAEEALRLEFKKALIDAEPFERNYDFDTEIKLVLEKANDIFDEERHLPPRLYYANHRLFATESPPLRSVTGYERSPHDSLIVVTAGDVSLVVRNTKGDYASRSHHFMLNYPMTGAALSPNDIKSDVRTELIQRANTFLAYCAIAVARTKEQMTQE